MAEEKKNPELLKQSPGKAKGQDTLDLHTIFEDQLYFDLFSARCHDTGEKPLCNQPPT